MRLYLSSFRVGDHPDRLLGLLPGGPGRIAVIADAMDAAREDVRRAGVAREVDALAALGFRPQELDLREFFDRPHAEVERALAPFRAVWVRGGNAFVLRHAMARSGADGVLSARLREDSLVYAGYSAGPCVLAPSLRGLELCDGPQQVTEVWGAEPLWDGLGVLAHAFVPHVDSPGHPETELCAEVAAHYRSTGVPHRTLRDGQVLLVDGDGVYLLG
ncbi:Type 1 glutamine amidotransferase-like domain-containing protein [Streptacidiphilus fuscans]|uniref:Type 1 glutamine amidotransferase-like domain-containing protein n=1 Tax=Streptacidiphilus fuscans TaxID=2789292 RepID=A0A931B1R3_9ACTN|nr:Type 1 glutamine amidotransferase-like domain-containing protein [Streptacidiphilus fuscans]MBF9069494.1 Type 1 glutamine amidotransferase-like domain-containing protein [Streptacidiphilus fuscans]